MLPPSGSLRSEKKRTVPIPENDQRTVLPKPKEPPPLDFWLVKIFRHREAKLPSGSSIRLYSGPVRPFVPESVIRRRRIPGRLSSSPSSLLNRWAAVKLRSATARR